MNTPTQVITPSGMTVRVGDRVLAAFGPDGHSYECFEGVVTRITQSGRLDLHFPQSDPRERPYGCANMLGVEAGMVMHIVNSRAVESA